MEQETIKQVIVSFIRQYAGTRPVVLGLSGGVDSSTVAFLAVEALGAQHVHGLIMPSSSSSHYDAELAQRVADMLGILTTRIDIDLIIARFAEAAPIFRDKRSLGNLKARIRMCLLYGVANEKGGLVLGTGNKTEIMVGYATKYGDAGCDLLPIGDLYKTDVFELARHLGVPADIINRAPTAGLWAGQTDEEELGITYAQLDMILRTISHNGDVSAFDEAEVTRVRNYIVASQHKRELPPVCVLTEK